MASELKEKHFLGYLFFMLFSSPSPYLLQDVKLMLATILLLSLPALFIFVFLTLSL